MLTPNSRSPGQSAHSRMLQKNREAREAKLQAVQREKARAEAEIKALITKVSQRQFGEGAEDIQKLMALINNFAKKFLMDELIENEQDTNRFEADLKVFTDWFTQGQSKLKPKMEFFYVPFMTDQRMRRHTMNNIKCRRATYQDANRSQERPREAGAPDDRLHVTTKQKSKSQTHGAGYNQHTHHVHPKKQRRGTKLAK